MLNEEIVETILEELICPAQRRVHRVLKKSDERNKLQRNTSSIPVTTKEQLQRLFNMDPEKTNWKGLSPEHLWQALNNSRGCQVWILRRINCKGTPSEHLYQAANNSRGWVLSIVMGHTVCKHYMRIWIHNSKSYQNGTQILIAMLVLPFLVPKPVLDEEIVEKFLEDLIDAVQQGICRKSKNSDERNKLQRNTSRTPMTRKEYLQGWLGILTKTSCIGTPPEHLGQGLWQGRNNSRAS